MSREWLAASHLLAGSKSGVSGSTVAAIIAAGVAVGTAILNVVDRRSHASQTSRNEFRRQALTDLQTAGVALREALRKYGPDPAAADEPELRAAWDVASSMWDVMLARVAAQQVTAAADTWQRAAEAYFLGDDSGSISAERSAWAGFQSQVGAELKHCF